MKKHHQEPLERIASALEWRNYFDWYRTQGTDVAFSAADDGTGPPPPPPPPPPPNEVGGD